MSDLAFKKLLQIGLLLLCSLIGYGQTIHKFEADFTIMQKNKIANLSTIFKGPWITRYYIGGIINAQNQAFRKKQSDYNDLVLEIIGYIKHCQSKS